MAEALEIGDLTPAEIEGAVALWQEAGLTRPWNDPIADATLALASPSSTILAGRLGKQIAATVMIGFDGHRGAAYYLAVANDHRRKGFGQAMMRAAEDWLKGRGAPKLNLMVRVDNAGVRGFYESIGYGLEDRLNFARRL